MKKITMILIVAAGLFSFTNAKAQVRISAGINIGSQPLWGPVGYDHADYYYLPDINVYYNIPEQVYYYRNGNNWKHAASLPPQYRSFDLYRAHKVVLNNVDRPYMNDNVYQRKYASYKGKHDQSPIRDSRDERYFENKDHPQHQQWVKIHQSDHSLRSNNDNDDRSNNENSGRKNNDNNGRRKG